MSINNIYEIGIVGLLEVANDKQQKKVSVEQFPEDALRVLEDSPAVAIRKVAWWGVAKLPYFTDMEIGVNQIGEDGKHHTYNKIVDTEGEF